MTEYLTIEELGKRIKMAPGTIRNLVWKGEFKEGIHYVKPTPRKILFIWSAIEDWLHGREVGPGQQKRRQPECLINMNEEIPLTPPRARVTQAGVTSEPKGGGQKSGKGDPECNR